MSLALSRRAGGIAAIRDDWAPIARLVRGAMRGLWRSARQLAVRLPGLAPEIIAIAAALLYVRYWAVAQPLWLDEEMIALNFRDRGFTELDGSLWLGQSAPLGWLVLQRAIMLAFGTGDMTVRLVSLLFGIATVGVAVWIGRRWLTTFGASVLVLLSGFGVSLSHYPSEAKHYTSDGFWALLLPALAIRATEGTDAPARTRRIALWWIAAAIGHWMSNGALFAAPGSAIVLCALMWHRHGLRASMTAALAGLSWLASFGVNYQLSIAHTHHNAYLRDYWASQLPGSDMTISQVLGWTIARLGTIADNPVGTVWWRGLWVASAAGFALGSRPALGLIFATAPAMMFLLAGLGVVPLYERFALWAVPAIYVGVALGLDRLWRIARDATASRRWWRVAAAGLVAIVPLAVTADIFARGRAYLVASRSGDHKQGFDDRSAGGWVASERRPGDAVITTRLGWPAIWWYGPYRLSAHQFSPGGADSDAFVAALRTEAADCAEEAGRRPLEGYSRAIVYLGFTDVPRGFDGLLLERLQQFGTVTVLQRFSAQSRGAIVEIRPPKPDDLPPAGLADWLVPAPRPDGCVVLRASRRW